VTIKWTLVAYPFSYSCEAIPAHAENLIEAALGAAKASKNVHGMAVATGSACNLLYPSPGNVIDWAYATAEIPFSYSIFLRDTGTVSAVILESDIEIGGQ
jgi:extracellular matrix protein 14